MTRHHKFILWAALVSFGGAIVIRLAHERRPVEAQADWEDRGSEKASARRGNTAEMRVPNLGNTARPSDTSGSAQNSGHRPRRLPFRSKAKGSTPIERIDWWVQYVCNDACTPNAADALRRICLYDQSMETQVAAQHDAIQAALESLPDEDRRRIHEEMEEFFAKSIEEQGEILVEVFGLKLPALQREIPEFLELGERWTMERRRELMKEFWAGVPVDRRQDVLVRNAEMDLTSCQ